MISEKPYNLQRNDFVTFTEEGHTYKDKLGNDYESVTTFLKKFKIPFDDKISYYMAKGMAEGQSTKEIVAAAEVIKDGWDVKRERSATWGTMVHSIVERALLNVEMDLKQECKYIFEKTGLICTYTKLEEAIKWLQHAYFQYYKVMPELLLYDQDLLISGTADIPLQRTKGTARSKPIVDIEDLKTNIEKGIQFDTIKREQDVWIKQYSRTMLPPVTYLEDCNYNNYALQLSMYALLIETMFNVSIGRLAIRYLDRDFQWHLYPVPYMRDTVCSMIRWDRNKQQPIPAMGRPLPEGAKLITSDTNDIFSPLFKNMDF